MNAPALRAPTPVRRIDHGRVVVLHGDVLDALPLLEAGSQHCVATSPPFWGICDYGLGPTRWPEITYTPMTGAPPITVPAMDAPLGLEPTLEAFVAHTVHVFRAVWPVLRDDGVAWVEYGDGYDCGTNAGRNPSSTRGKVRANRPSLHKVSGWTDRCQSTRRSAGLKTKDLLGVPWRVALALQADGWWLRGDHVWGRPNAMPESITDRPTRSHSFAFLLAKAEIYFFDTKAIAERTTETTGNRNRVRTYADRVGVPAGTGRSERGVSFPWDGTAATKNPRSVWMIPTQPFRGAHFATWPEALAEKFVLSGTSGFGACAACGAPYPRRVQDEVRAVEDFPPQFARAPRAAAPIRWGRREARLLRRLGAPVAVGVSAWRPGCRCGAPVVPCRVLDLFGGSGTTGRVGARLGREVTLIEAQATYLPLIAKRVGAVAAQGHLRGIG